MELFCIEPYELSYSDGFSYYHDGRYINVSPHVSKNEKGFLFFEKEEELLNWFYLNAGIPIPKVYRVKYWESFKGLNDVIEITDITNTTHEIYTLWNEEDNLEYDFSLSEKYQKDIWKENPISFFSLLPYFKEFKRRGIIFKNDSLNNEITLIFNDEIRDALFDESDMTLKSNDNIFDAVCDIEFESQMIKDKEVILNRINPKYKRISWF